MSVARGCPALAKPRGRAWQAWGSAGKPPAGPSSDPTPSQPRGLGRRGSVSHADLQGLGRRRGQLPAGPGSGGTSGGRWAVVCCRSPRAHPAGGSPSPGGTRAPADEPPCRWDRQVWLSERGRGALPAIEAGGQAGPPLGLRSSRWGRAGLLPLLLPAGPRTGKEPWPWLTLCGCPSRPLLRTKSDPEGPFGKERGRHQTFGKGNT